MNKFIFLCFGILILSATSHAMDIGQELVRAAESGDIKHAEALLKQGAPIEAKSNSGLTPLHSAARNGYPETCKFLIDNKASIDAQDNTGWTPLFYPARDGLLRTCKLLIERKARIDAKDDARQTPLIVAASNGRDQICKLLIDNKATIDAKSKYGWTPLHSAARNGYPETCKLLIDAILVPIKQEQATAIAFLGMKKYRNTPYFHQIDREVIRLIIRPPYEISKQQLFAQINAIADQDLKKRLLDYATQQLRMQNGETSHE